MASNVKRKTRRTVNQRRPAATNRVVLEKVLGLSTATSSGLASDPHSSLIAYPAGYVVVLLHTQTLQQKHIISSSKKTFTALAFCHDGRYLVTGESGHMPCVRVWCVKDRKQIAEVQCHKYGVACVRFSPDDAYIVSVGYQHDSTVSVWDWRKGTIAASNKVSSRVLSLSFSEESRYFVTAGNRHVKFWYLDVSKRRVGNSTVPLIGRSALLGEHKANVFCGVACGHGPTRDNIYCITRTGLLCLFNKQRKLTNWVDLKVSWASAVCVSLGRLFCGCSDGIIRVFQANNLSYMTTLPRPHRLGVDLTQPLQTSPLPQGAVVSCPDVLALSFDPVSSQLSCVYNDHSVYVWNVAELNRVLKVYSALYHSAAVWNIQTYPDQSEGSEAYLPAGSFLTSSSDNTIRVWHPDLPPDSMLANLYSRDLLRVVYVGEDIQHLQTETEDGAMAAAGAEGKVGVRVMAVSPDGKYLAAGDRSGNIRVLDLQFVEELTKIEAHDSEVLCLEFSPPSTGVKLLASASRDRLIHIFDMEDNYNLLQTVYEHSGSVTAVCFTGICPDIHMVSCGADKSIYFRTAEQTDGFSFSRRHHVVEKTTLYDMDLDASNTHIAIACQDRNIRVYDVQSGKMTRCFKGSSADEGTVLKVQIDPSGTYMATSDSDKNICILDYLTGDCVATLYGHSEIIMSMTFTEDCRHLISVSADSCVFIWRLDHHMITTMTTRLSAGVKPSPCRKERRQTFIVSELSRTEDEEDISATTLEVTQDEAFRSVTPTQLDLTSDLPPPLETNRKMPMWFRKLEATEQNTVSVVPVVRGTPDSEQPHSPRGRWERLSAPLPIWPHHAASPHAIDTAEPEEEDVNFHPHSLDALLREEDDTGDYDADQASSLPTNEEGLAGCHRRDYIVFPSGCSPHSAAEGEFGVQGAPQMAQRVEPQPLGEELSPDSACCVSSTANDDCLSQGSSTESSGCLEDDRDVVDRDVVLRKHFEDLCGDDDGSTADTFDTDLRTLEYDDADRNILNVRLSISARFLSRFHNRLRVGTSHAASSLRLPSVISEEPSDMEDQSPQQPPLHGNHSSPSDSDPHLDQSSSGPSSSQTCELGQTMWSTCQSMLPTTPEMSEAAEFKAADCQGRQSNSRLGSSSPTHRPSSPAHGPSSPAHGPSSPAHGPSSPALVPSSPALVPSSPALRSSPVLVPSSPTHVPSSPDMGRHEGVPSHVSNRTFSGSSTMSQEDPTLVFDNNATEEQQCQRAINELMRAARRVVGLYEQKRNSEPNSQIASDLKGAASGVQTLLATVSQEELPIREETTRALLEKYSSMLVQHIQSKLDG